MLNLGQWRISSPAKPRTEDDSLPKWTNRLLIKNHVLKLQKLFSLIIEPVVKFKKSGGRKFDTSRCCRKWFWISYTKRKLRNCEWPLKLLGEKISPYWESWFSRICQNVHLSDVHNRSEVIKIFHLFLYSIEISLFKHVLWDKMWSRTIGELNLNWTMPKILKLQKLKKFVMTLSICWTYQSGEPIDGVKKNLTQTVSSWD